MSNNLETQVLQGAQDVGVEGKILFLIDAAAPTRHGDLPLDHVVLNAFHQLSLIHI